MGFFKRLFSSDDIENDIDNDFYSHHWADPITTGWEYTCNLYLTTPKICLENDGLIIKYSTKKPDLFGEPNKFGIDGDPSGNFGYWIRRHGYEEEFEELANISENMIYARNSDIGKIPPKSQLEKDFKTFLIEFRKIVESSRDVKEKIIIIKEILCKMSNINYTIYKKLIIKNNFPDEFFRKKLLSLRGVNPKLSEIFWKEGYFSPEEILNASDSELLEINGITKSILSKIRSN
tara:strand:- start:278 stop:979 length:702 start_codon:yes stop_codon:yes gene_type:complete